MSSAVLVEHVAKRYCIGAAASRRHGTLSEQMAAAAAAPWRWLKRRASGASAEGGGARSTELWALRDISFKVDTGEVLALVGRNGAGKSTLLKILSRITYPTQGRIQVRGRVGSLLEVGTGFHPELTGRENVFLNGAILGMSRREIERKFDAIVAFSEVERFLDTPVKRYSSGMYTRLAFAVASHLEPEILVVDEVLAVGDAAFQKKCLKRIEEVSRNGRTVLFVSHNMVAVKTLCRRAVLFDEGRVELDGPVDQVVDRYLAGGAEVERPSGGIIPANAPRVSDVPGESYVRRVRLTTLDGEDTTQLHFGQPFQVGMTVDVTRDLEDAHFEVSVSTLDGTHVTYATTIDGGGEPMYLPAGRHEIWAKFDGVLLPREYTLDVGVHHQDGQTSDFVMRTLDFAVLRVGQNGNDHYRWPKTRGLVRMAGRWSVQRVEGSAVL